MPRPGAPRQRIVHHGGVRVVRNVAIIAVLALAVAELPAGGSVASGLLAALTLVMCGAIGMLVVRLWRDNSLARDAMTDRQRGLIYWALGAIALMVAGADELLSSGPGTLVWIAILAGSVWLIFNTWREANSI
jgi:hypothetical protein